MWEHENVFSLVVQLLCCWAGGERNNQQLGCQLLQISGILSIPVTVTRF